ncbi:MAG: non-canonical purine NTP pyrophosphatase [Gemmatimonadota bacterium]
MRVLVATRRAHKVAEIAEIFDRSPIRLVSLADLGLERTPAEDDLERFDTFAANALGKARHFRDRCGLPTLADDSGLRVDALDGAPGVRSKRFAPPELQAELGIDAANNRHLLDLFQGVPPERRTAHFVCTVALALADAERVFAGRVDGRILDAPRGERGFGYDPLFFVPELGRTLAEIGRKEKNEWSHRGRAVRAARAWLETQAKGGA